MISRFRWVSIAVFALLTVASVCAAQDSLRAITPATTPAASTPAPAPPAVETGPRSGFGGIGGQFGGSFLPSAEDYSKESEPRMSFAGVFRYYMGRSVRWQISPGFFWAGYTKRSTRSPFQDPNFPSDTTKDNYLTLVAPATAQLQLVHRGKQFTWHAGAGVGAYRVWVENYRKVLKDPVTLRLHRGVYPGATFEIGAERFFKALTTTSVELTVDAHQIYAKRDAQFPSGFNSSLSGVGIRIGGNYYFNAVKPQTALPVAGKKKKK
jgi:hypothetical protein